MKFFRAVSCIAAAVLCACAATAVEVSYSLALPGNVTIVIEDSAGRRVRNLLSDAPRQSGRNSEEWDGRDDFGNPMPLGEYRWRGIAHGEITANWSGSFYSPGSTPWKQHTRPGGWNLRPSGAGGWLSDHVAPWCLFTDSEHVYVGCKTAEAGDAIIQCDLNGCKKWGALWLGLSGAHAMCTDGSVLYVAGEGFWMGERLGVNLFDIKGYKWVPLPKPVKDRHVLHDSALVREKSSDFSGIVGMYLTDDCIVLLLSDRRRLSFFDRKSGVWLRNEPLSAVKSLLGRPSTKIMHGVATDADGNIYRCATNRNEQCVKVFSPDGRLVRRIGKRGGRREGRYDPAAMGNPVDVAVDARGLVWVCENSFLPKRVSVWTKEGALVREYVGTPFYGGGGSIDSAGRFAYYSGMRFRIRPDFSGADLDAVLYDPDAHPEVPQIPRGNTEMWSRPGPSSVREVGGRTYLVSDDGFSPKQAFIGEVVGDKLVPRVVVGAEPTPGSKGQTDGVFLWQEGERTVSRDFAFGSEWAMRIGPGLEIVLRTRDKKSLAVLKPIPGSALRYDFATVERIPLPAELARVCSLSMTPDAKSFIVNCGGCGNQGSTNNLFGAVSRAGNMLWTYPNPYPSNTHNSPVPRRGELRHTLGIEGFSSSAGGLMLLNGNKGTRYLFTIDGLFVTELFGDMRLRPATQNLSEARRGMVFSGNSLSDECFFGWFGDVRGRPTLIEGKDSLNICELRGTESVSRLGGGKVKVSVAAKPLANVPLRERGPARTVKAAGFGLNHEWWKLAEYAMPQMDPIARFSIGWSESSLTLHYDVDDDTPFENGGDAPHTLFHSGDALDFRWEGDATADARRRTPVIGDQRLVIAPLGGRIVVMRYVYVDSSSSEKPMEFVSPVGRTIVQRVEEVTGAKVDIARRNGGYAARIDIPWKALGEAVPFRGGVRRADAGVIFGDATGTRVVRRQYLFDDGGQEVSDIPSEVRVNPATWGTFEF